MNNKKISIITLILNILVVSSLLVLNRLHTYSTQIREVTNQANELPTVIDTDGDGLNDQQEARLGTSPILPDTDGDGYMDGQEVNSNYNPLAIPSIDPSNIGDDYLLKDESGAIYIQHASNNQKNYFLNLIESQIAMFTHQI